MSQSVLPPAFAALEPYAAWCLATETERNRRRVTVPFAEITQFAEAVLPHAEAIAAHLDAEAAKGALSDQALKLYYLLLSLAEVAPAIESYDPQAIVIDGYETARFIPDETHVLRPKT